MLKRVAIPPGIDKESTQYSAAGRWFDCNNMRFRGGVPEVIGGWSQDGSYTLEGLARASFTSRDYSGNNFQFVGTDWKYYVISGDGAHDITPVRADGTVSMVFKSENLKPNIRVTHTNHGLSVDDWVVFTSGITADLGDVTSEILMQPEGFQVSWVDSPDVYYIYTVNRTVDPPVVVLPDASEETFASTGYSYKVTSGISTVVTGSGWGAGEWGGDEDLKTVYDLVEDPIGYEQDNGLGTEGGYWVKIPDGMLSELPSVDTGDSTIPLSSDAEDAGFRILIRGLNSLELVNGISSVYLLQNYGVGFWDVSLKRAYIYPVQGAIGSGATPFPAPSNPEPSYGGGTDGNICLTLRGWGTASSVQLATDELRRVYIDNYGEDVMFCNSGGPIYYWDVSENTSTGVPVVGESGVAVAMTKTSVFTEAVGVPSVVDSFLISKKDGHCVALGCNDLGAVPEVMNSLLVRWSDQSNPFDWIPTATNTSGGQVLRVGSRIIGGVSTKDEVVIFTDAAVYSMRFIGAPVTFSFTLITEGVELLSPLCAVNVVNSVFFMGNDGFYTYTGSVAPLPSTVSKYVFDDINLSEKGKAFAAVNSAFSEVMWFYPSRDSFEPDRYVVFNYEENVWSIGKFDMSSLSYATGGGESYARTSWRDAIVYSNPMATYISNYNPLSTGEKYSTVPMVKNSAVMVHEKGSSAQSKGLDPYIESGEVEIGEGDFFSFVSRIIPDLQLFDYQDPLLTSEPVVNISLFGRDYPGNAVSSSSSTDVTFARDGSLLTGTYEPTGSSTAIRMRARTIAMKLSSGSTSFKWRSGAIRFDARPDGMR